MPNPPPASLIDRVASLPPVWHVVWAGLVLLSLALLVLSRTRWGQSKPLHKCAVLSLLAHVLLACLATTVQIVGTAAIPERRPTIRVALVSGEEGASEEDIMPRDVQPWEGLRPGPVSRPELPPFLPPREDADAVPFDLAEDFLERLAEDGATDIEAPATLPDPEPLLGNDTASDPETAREQSVLAPTPVELPFDRDPAPPIEEPKLTSADRPRLDRADLAPAPPAMPLDQLEQEWLDVAALDGQAPEASSLVELPPVSPSEQAEESGENAAAALALANRSSEPAATAAPRPQEISPDVSASPVRHAPEGHPRTPRESVAESSGPTDAATDRPSVYRHRQEQERTRLVQEHGGSEETEAAVDRALQWLSRAQSLDGRWDAVRHGAGRERAVLGHNRQGAGAQADTGVTGLALLAFLGAGHTHREGNYHDEVQKGLAFLVRIQADDGNLAGQATLYARMYCHAMAAFALSEAYAMTGDPALADPVAQAVAYTAASQHVGGGWRYRPGDPGDTSQLGWQLMALRSAEMAGVAVPDVAWQRAGRFLEGVSRGRAGGLAAYQPTTGVSRAMSAEASYCKLLLAGRAGQFEGLAAMCDETAEYLRSEPPGSGRPNFYSWYYSTLLFHLRQNSSQAAQQDWRTWNEALKTTLLASQHRTGPLAGAWGSDTVWGGYGGRIYTTALAALCLETYYRYLPLLSRPPDRTALRPGLLHQRAMDR